VLAHKLREAMASSMKGLQIGGAGRVAEIDGAYFGGHVRPENRAADRIDRRRAENRSGKRRVVVAMRERDGRTLAQVFGGEEAAVPAIRQRIAHGTVVHADESPAWNPLHARFAMQRVNHQDGYSIDGACTNGAEAYFSRLRRAELGHHHHIAGPYLVRYAQEAAWREDLRRVSNGEQAHGVVGLAIEAAPRSTSAATGNARKPPSRSATRPRPRPRRTGSWPSHGRATRERSFGPARSCVHPLLGWPSRP